MREDFNELGRKEKIRIIVFIVITMIVAAFAIAYVWEFRELSKEQPIRTDNMDVNIDGGNFNWFFVPMASGVNGLIMLISAGVYVVFLAVIDLLVYGVFRVIAFRKIGFVSEAEYILAKKVFAIILIGSILISLVVTRFHFLLFIALLIFPMWLFGYLFYILPLKHKRQK